MKPTIIARDHVFPLAGYRLNCFAGISSLDFKRDVYDKLPEDRHRKAFDAFASKFEAAFDAKYRARLQEGKFFEPPDDFTKLRFLQADHYNVDKAVERLCKTLIWRQTVGLDDFLEDPRREKLMRRYRALRSRTLLGYCPDGSTLQVERLGEFFSSMEAAKALPMEAMVLAYSLDVCEVFASCRESAELRGDGKYVHVCHYIGDVKGLSYWTSLKMVPILKTLTENVECHFPEIAGHIFLINAPRFATVIWNMVKVFLDPNTAAKITMLSSDGKEELIKKFPREIIPKEFGGDLDLELPHIPTKITEEFETMYPLVEL